MRLGTIVFAVILLAIIACKNKKKSQQLKDTLTQIKIDTARYLSLPYWTKDLDRFSDAYIDTFSVGGNSFQFLNPVATHQTGGNSVTLQKLINGKWTETNLILYDNIHGGNFFHNQDINGDGYIDIVNIVRFYGVVYFYNPNINSFIDTPAKEKINPDWFLLDKEKNIYCDFQQVKGMCDQIHSKLYTYRGFKRIDLYDLTLFNCTETNNETNLITKLILSQRINENSDSAKIIEETKLDKPIDTDGYNDQGKYPNGTDEYFDYKKYWQAKYKKLLGGS